MNRILILLYRVAHKFNEHLCEDKVLRHGYTVGTCLGTLGIECELINIFMSLNSNYPPALDTKAVFELCCPNIPFDKNIDVAMKQYANQLRVLFQDTLENGKVPRDIISSE